MDGLNYIGPLNETVNLKFNSLIFMCHHDDTMTHEYFVREDSDNYSLYIFNALLKF